MSPSASNSLKLNLEASNPNWITECIGVGIMFPISSYRSSHLGTRGLTYTVSGSDEQLAKCDRFQKRNRCACAGYPERYLTIRSSERAVTLCNLTLEEPHGDALHHSRGGFIQFNAPNPQYRISLEQNFEQRRNISTLSEHTSKSWHGVREQKFWRHSLPSFNFFLQGVNEEDRGGIKVTNLPWPVVRCGSSPKRREDAG